MRGASAEIPAEDVRAVYPSGGSSDGPQAVIQLVRTAPDLITLAEKAAG